ncbi:PREDICTED: uncharacterized protein LOC108566908 [Nicrophorus vespilloides]|uniref:Uncharacterized protein LOC108566908 n=1 Tax=Nicrophorus vespilloides TaxID=110193 RepID=A0ABM1N6S1_NICVS|nr:PREDICTED: uncharacterized protein LOC108566908 [Nicrophorus vespilloides]
MGKKRKIADGQSDNSAKKPRSTLISIEEFRKQIKTDYVSDAFRLFYKDCCDDPESIVEYLNNGGSCEEILYVLTSTDTTVPNNLVMEICNFITRYIMVKQKSKEQYLFKMYYKFFNNHFDIIKNMISGTDEDANIATLKLLSNVVLLSPVLANYVFLNLKLKLEHLKNLADGKNSMSVRNAFIRFIMAYIVNPKVNAVSLILLNPELIGFIIAGLKHDPANLVCLFLSTLLTALDKHSLSNKRTVRTKIVVKIFQPQLVTNLVRLYNWVGPESLTNPKALANKEEKEKVSECLHEFLLFIYTKYGFVNPSKRFILNSYCANRLEPIVVVLDKMEKPWEHRHVKLFVAKLCSYLVDLAPIMWKKLQEHIENTDERSSRAKAFEYIPLFLEALHPSCLDYTKKYLQVEDFSRIMQQYILPPTILKVLVDEVNGFKKDPKNVLESLKALEKVVELIISYQDTSRRWYSEEFCSKLMQNLEVTIMDALPTSGVLLERCNVEDGESKTDKVEIVLNILKLYKTCCPYLLEEINLINFLNSIDEDGDKFARIVIKSVEVFETFGEDLALCSTKSFQRILKSVLLYLFDNREDEVRKGVCRIFKQTMVFDEDESEIEVWIDGILSFETMNMDVVKFLGKKLLASIKINKVGRVSKLMYLIFSTKTEQQDYVNFVALNWLHRVINTGEFIKFLLNFHENIDSDVFKYIKSWGNGKAKRLSCGSFEKMSQLSKAIFKGEEYTDILTVNNPHLLRMIIFYICNYHEMSEEGYQICLKSAKSLAKPQDILSENLLKTKFDLGSKNNANKFVVDLLEDDVGEMIEYRTKICEFVLKIDLRAKHDSDLLSKLIQFVHLNVDEGQKVFQHFAKFNSKSFIDNKIFFDIFIWASEALLKEEKMVSAETFQLVLNHLIYLNKSNYDSARLSKIVDFMIVKYPHLLKCVDDKLIDSFLCKPDFDGSEIQLIVNLFRCGKNRKDFLETLQIKQSNLLVHLLKAAFDLKTTPEELLWLFQLLDIRAFLKNPKCDDLLFKNYDIICELIALHSSQKQAEKFMGKYEASVESHQIAVAFSLLRSNPILVDEHISKLIKSVLDLCKLEKYVEVEVAAKGFHKLLESVDKLTCNLDFAQTLLIEGMNSRLYLLKLLSRFLQLVDFSSEIAGRLMGQIGTHANCAKILLNDKGSYKEELLGIIMCLGEKYPEVLKKESLGLLLACYGATNSNADLKVFSLLQLYELNAARTQFYTFMPIVWGPGANDIYDLENKERNSHEEIRQVLGGLDMIKVQNTIKNCSLDVDFWESSSCNDEVYNLSFFLPYFSNLLKTTKIGLLAPKFARSGALSLVLLALANNSEKTRMAAWYVLGRLYESLEKFRTEQKFAIVYSRFIAAVCKGVVKTKNYQISNVAAVYLSKAVTMLASNRNAMYEPIIMYLGAMESIPLNTVPDMLQMLTSTNLEHQMFILEVICDGLRAEKDVWVLFDNNIFVYLMEMFTSHASSAELKLKIVEIIMKTTKYQNCFKRVNANFNFLNWLSDSVTKCADVRVFEKLLVIYSEVVRCSFINLKLTTCLLSKVIGKFEAFRTDERVALEFAKCMDLIGQKNISLIKKEMLETVLRLTGSDHCKYLLDYSVKVEILSERYAENSVDFYCKQLTTKFVHSHKNECNKH